MFVFYDIEDLILMDRLRLLKVVTDNGYDIVVPEMRLLSYSYKKRTAINEIAKKGLITITEQKDSLSDFIEEHEDRCVSAGKSLLGLIHFCTTENAILVLNDKKCLPFAIANDFSIGIFSLEEFYLQAVKEEKYYKFIMELKKEELLE